MTQEPIEGTISPWMPVTDQQLLAVLGKLGEEGGELAARCCRCIIQGLDELDPDTGRTNREELSREISDVAACMQMLHHTEGVGTNPERVNGKFAGFQRWRRMIRDRLAR